MSTATKAQLGSARGANISAKAMLADAGCRGSSLPALASDACTRMHNAIRDRMEVHEVLRAAGIKPEGKRLAAAVSEAIRKLTEGAS